MNLKQFYWIQAWAELNGMNSFASKKDVLAILISDSLKKEKQMEIIGAIKPKVVMSQDYSDFLNVNIFVTPIQEREKLMGSHEKEMLKLAELVPSGPSKSQIMATIQDEFSRKINNPALADMIAQYYTEDYIGKNIALLCRNYSPVIALLHPVVAKNQSMTYAKLEEPGIGYISIN